MGEEDYNTRQYFENMELAQKRVNFVFLKFKIAFGIRKIVSWRNELVHRRRIGLFLQQERLGFVFFRRRCVMRERDIGRVFAFRVVAVEMVSACTAAMVVNANDARVVGTVDAP